MKNMRIHSVLTLLALTLSMGLHAAPKTVKLTERFCEPTRLLVGCQVLDATGTYSVEVTPDSIVEVDLQIGVPETKVEASIKKGETFLFGCEKFDKEGVYPVTFQSSWGCDSVVNLHLSYASCDTAYAKFSKQLCPGDLPYTYKGFVIVSDSVIREVIEGGAASGCDSITTLTFKVNKLVNTINEEKTLCPGSKFMWRGQVCSEAKTYYDTLRYKSGCDSILYTMKVSFHKIPRSERTMEICENQLPYLYIGESNFIIRTDTTINDTIFGGAKTGCDSVDGIQFVINRPKALIMRDTMMCPDGYIIWRQKVLTEAKTYYDTIRYKSTGCDSVIYGLNIQLRPTPRTEVSESLCLSAAKAKYPQFKIQKSGTFIDTLVSALGCDSIVTYNLTIYVQPKAPAITRYADLLPYVACGMPVQAAALQAALDKAARDARLATEANIAELWLEARLTAWENFQKLDDSFLPQGESIELRVAIKTECDEMVYGSPATFQVEVPTPDNVPELDNLPAVSKYMDWLLMLDYHSIKEMGYEFAATDVAWYRINGDQDPAVAIRDDAKVGGGFYYTADKSLTGRYYAIINTGDACGTKLRTMTLVCVAEGTLQLAPRTIHAGQAMTLSQLDPEQPATLTFFAPDGKMLKTITIEGQESYSFRPNAAAGLYLLRVKNGDVEASFKYIITK